METSTAGTWCDFMVTEWGTNCLWMGVVNWNMYQETVEIKCIILLTTSVYLYRLHVEVPDICIRITTEVVGVERVHY
jgi:hypothetical protein